MNKQKQTSSEIAANIKSLRDRKTASKPFYLAVWTAVTDGAAFIGRMTVCDAQNHSSNLASSNQGGAAVNQRFCLNEYGKWAVVKK